MFAGEGERLLRVLMHSLHASDAPDFDFSQEQPGRASSSEPTINTLLGKDPWLLPPETRPEWGYEKKEQGETRHPSPLKLLVPSFWLSFS